MEKLPVYQGYFNDYAGYYEQSSKIIYENLLRNMAQTNRIALVFAIVNDYSGLGSIEMYSVELFEKWKPGKEGKDQGMLVVFNPAKKEIRIEVGYGLEGDFPDGYVGQLLDEFIHLFEYQGKYKATLSLIATIAQKAGVTLSYGGEKKKVNPQSQKTNPIIMIIMLVFFIILFIRNPFLAMYLMSSFFARGASGSFSGGLGGFGGGSSGGGGASRRF